MALLALALTGIGAGAADASPMAITSPLPGSAATTLPTFEGTGVPGEAPVSVTVYAGASTAGSVVAELTASVGEAGTWKVVDPLLVLLPGLYTVTAAQTGAQPPVSEPVTFTFESEPLVTQQPAASTVLVGQGASFTATASGFPAPAVTWQKRLKGEVAWTNDISDTGVNTTQLSIAHASAEENESEYRAVFESAAGTAHSEAAKLFVDSAPIVSKNPQDAGTGPGQTVHFRSAANGVPAPEVRWQVSTDFGESWSEDTTDAGNSTPELSVLASISADGYEYRAVFTNAAGTAFTTAATLTVSEPAAKPEVTGQPEPETVIAGGTAVFTAAASGSPTPTVQWEVSTDGGEHWAADHDTGSRSTTLAITGAELSQSGNRYRALFTNRYGTATTRAATLTVLSGQTPPAVTAQPSPATVLAGEAAIFTSSASGTPAPTVQWQVSRDGGATWSLDSADGGATSNTLVVSPASAAESGYRYRALFTNPAGTATSAAATLTVRTPAPAPAPVPAPPVASFSWFPATPHVGEAVSLISTSSSPDATIARLAWSLPGSPPFAEGGPAVSTSFATVGPHPVTLRVTDSDGQSATVTQIISVAAQAVPLMQPFPVVRIAGSDTSSGARLSIVSVLAPAGSTVSVTCSGHGCHTRRVVRAVPASGGVALISFRTFQTRLGAGARLVIRVWHAGEIGKYTSFTVRSGRLPVRVDSCLSPAGVNPMPCPAL